MGIVQLSKDVVFRDLSGEAVLLNLATGIYFGLNETGTRMWTLLAEHGATEPVLQTLAQEYDVPEETLRADLAKLVQDLASKGVIHVAE